MNTANEYRVFGPPGTGKTTYLVDQILKAGDKHGFGKIMVASFTRTAAREISVRAMAKLPQGVTDEPNFGTLHAHGYRSIGGTMKVAENCVKQWNEDHPAYQLSGGKNADVDDVQEFAPGLTSGDELYNEMMMNRSLMVPRERWRIAVQAFASKWESWKSANGIVDYTDMLEIPFRDVATAPYSPTIGILDEAQDASPLQMALFRKWGAEMEYIILGGDPDQTIFEWAGARPEVMVCGEYAGKRVLSQSYRVPRAIHALATRTIKTVRVREDVDYLPRDYDGEVRNLRGTTLGTPAQILRDMQKYLENGKSVMFLATCAYMLDPLIKEMRAAGIPFHNPYRTKAGAWNPLRGISDTRGVSSSARLLAFRNQVPCISDFKVDAPDFLSWYEILKTTGNIPRGQRDRMISKVMTIIADYNMPERVSVPAEFLGYNVDSMVNVPLEKENFFRVNDIYDGGYFENTSSIFEYFGRPDLEADAVKWFLDNVIAAKQKTLEYPAKVLLRNGPDALQNEPKIIIGTIHSVKGGEADVVYVAPDVSRSGFVSMNSTLDARDSMTRLKYVAYTRARESLILLDPATGFSM